MTDSIHDLFQKVREHPDFAGGAIWTRDDVAGALFEDEDDLLDPSSESISRVSSDMLQQSKEVLESFIFEGAYGWNEALRDNIEAD